MAAATRYYVFTAGLKNMIYVRYTMAFMDINCFGKFFFTVRVSAKILNLRIGLWGFELTKMHGEDLPSANFERQ